MAQPYRNGKNGQARSVLTGHQADGSFAPSTCSTTSSASTAAGYRKASSAS
ncbi:MAG: hypothetical protein ACI8UD_000551, partial [Planctomycetota bacterium]